MPSKASTLKLFRQIHLYFGVFISPAILFFAITGALQTFSLHETTKGSDYKPPAWLVKLGQLHKKQTLVVPVRRPQPPAPAAAPAKPADLSSPSASKPASQPDAAAPKPKNLLPMKLFFLLVSIGLVISTFTGIYMAYKYNRSKSWVTALLVTGIAVPLLLLLF
ncbi:hypothetical protein HDF16_000437 [Granulicella aggregans]|uniref:PepSY-associated transmembrane protein n=1 Tax=Granulicella aggregans TaxID=474949 RepID=A0A7W7Z9N0_9BACT|nr:PepSY domain-containing protein [Granulicella aggregans]MBB5055768.1 hypothetical protein [Granulicella aggregans]